MSQTTHPRIEETAIGKCCVVGATTEDSEALVIVLHGLGDNGENWVGGADFLHRFLPNVRFLIPTAPIQPVTLNMGMQMNSWYDIVGLDDRSAEHCEGIDESRDNIWKLLTTEMEQSNLEPRQAAILGFSQGGALALNSSLLWDGDKPLAGVVCHSGYLPQASLLEQQMTDAGKSTTVQFVHGDCDDVVPLDLAKHSYKILQTAHLDVAMTVIQGMGHHIDQDSMTTSAKALLHFFPWIKDAQGINPEGPSKL